MLKAISSVKRIMINTEEVKNSLKTKYIGKRIFYHDLLDSTNLEALRMIEDSQASHGDIIIAKHQTFGRGQQDHRWTSPEGGLYMSIITASKASEASNLITFVSGVSCIDAIKNTTGISANLKWVNDIIINQQKLGGILTETITRGQISTHVSGIGINVNVKVGNLTGNKFNPVSLAELSGKDIDINILIAEICSSFEKYFAIYQENNRNIIPKWLEYSNIIGLEVNHLTENGMITGTITGINNYGHLIVKCEDKEYSITSTKNTEIIYS